MGNIKMSGKDAVVFYEPTEYFEVGKESILEDKYYEARTLKGQLNYYLKKKELTITALSMRTADDPKQISRYSTGERNPDRITVIRLGLGLALEQEDMNRLLSAAGFADLSPKRKADALILGHYEEIEEKLQKNDEGIDYDYLYEINKMLFDAGCEKLFKEQRDV